MDKDTKKRIKYAIAKWLFFIPDAPMLSFQYWLKTGRRLNLKNPSRFTEKLQYYKMHYHNDDMKRCVDKYDVRAFVEERLATGKYLNTLYQVCHKADEIDFDALPNQFVIKTTDGGDGVNVMVCTDKSKLDIKDTIKTVNSWRNKRYDRVSREWAYKGATNSRVIVEKYLEDESNADGSIDDYKFLCFDGNFLEGVYSDWPTFEKGGIPLPENIQEMIELSEKLAKGFPFARIDWYNIKGIITFGEITFYPWSGYVQYTPDSFDFDLGKYLILK